MTRQKYTPAIRIAILTGALALAACSSEQPSDKQASCDRQGDNLIQDTRFETLFARRSERRWHASEHAAGGTFKHEAEDGVLRIRKIGKEPWFLVAQGVETKSLAGKTIAFSAQIKLNLHEPRHPHSLGYGGGLSVLAKRGGKVVVKSSIEHEPNFGVQDWTPVEVIFQLPMKSTYLRAGFLHQAGGSIEIRNPELYVVEQGCPVTIAEQDKPA